MKQRLSAPYWPVRSRGCAPLFRRRNAAVAVHAACGPPPRVLQGRIDRDAADTAHPSPPRPSSPAGRRRQQSTAPSDGCCGCRHPRLQVTEQPAMNSSSAFLASGAGFHWPSSQVCPFAGASIANRRNETGRRTAPYCRRRPETSASQPAYGDHVVVNLARQRQATTNR